jgi:hypothetical protein
MLTADPHAGTDGQVRTSGVAGGGCPPRTGARPLPLFPAASLVLFRPNYATLQGDNHVTQADVFAAEALARLVVQARPALDNVGPIFRRRRRRRSMTMVVR